MESDYTAYDYAYVTETYTGKTHAHTHTREREGEKKKKQTNQTIPGPAGGLKDSFFENRFYLHLWGLGFSLPNARACHGWNGT